MCVKNIAGVMRLVLCTFYLRARLSLAHYILFNIIRIQFEYVYVSGVKGQKYLILRNF